MSIVVSVGKALDENNSYLFKKCTNCGWNYTHPLSDSYADYDFDCPSCGTAKALKTDKDKAGVYKYHAN